MNVLSLFAGIGGLDLGLERAGMTVVGQVEIDPFCQRVLARHWPEVPRHDDVRTTVDWWMGEPRPAVDVVCGGFPCQPVSLAGRGLAQADERWLWPAAHAVIRDLRPRFAVLENVPGLLGRGLGHVLGDLAEIGYDAEWDCVPASAVGAPHRRDRVFILAYPQRDGVRDEPKPEPGGGGTAVAVADGTTGSVANTNSIEYEVGTRTQRRSTAPLVLANADCPAELQAGNAVSDDGSTSVLGGGPTEPGGRGRDVADSDGQRQLQPGRSLGQEWRRPSDSGWWATEPTVDRVAYGVPARVDRLRALGNAVVPQVAEHIGRLVMAGAA